MWECLKKWIEKHLYEAAAVPGCSYPMDRFFLTARRLSTSKYVIISFNVENACKYFCNEKITVDHAKRLVNSFMTE